MAVEEAKASGGLLRYTSQWTSYVGQWVKHHVFPRQFRDNFARIFGKDIIDNYTLRVPDWVNKYLHYMTDWNQQWKCFFDYYRRLGRDPSPKEAARFLRWLRAGLKDVKFTEFIKYR